MKDFAIFTLDPMGNVLNWNTGAERLTGYRAEEIIGKHFSVFYSEEDRNAGKPGAILEKAVAVGQHEEEGWRIRKDGSRFWAEIIITALYDESGNLRGFSKVTRDLSERKNAEDTLRFSEARYQMRENSVIEFGVVDIDGLPAYYIRDNGSGFDKVDADKIFLPFQRLPRTEKYIGFGIGLATVERIIRRHGGKVGRRGAGQRSNLLLHSFCRLRLVNKRLY